MADILLKAFDDYQADPKSNWSAFLDLDVALFAKSSEATPEQRTEAVRHLVLLFADEKREDRFTAGVLLADLLAHSWSCQGVHEGTLENILEQLSELSCEDQKLRNMQARVVALCLEHMVLAKMNAQADAATMEGLFSALFEPLATKIQEGDSNEIDVGLSVVRLFIDRFDEMHPNLTRKLYHILPILLPALLQAFTLEEAGIHGREQILHLFYLLIRLITWADGIDNDLVSNCLEDSFNQWMALFLQIIQSKKRYFNVKKNALKCLTVIFRDLINFSRDSINMILKPAWKLLNSHLPVFTEVLAYNNPLPQQDDASDEEAAEVGNESFDESEMYGVEGMTFHLLELLSTLVLRPNVQQLVLTGLVPMLTSVSSYLLIQHSHERVYRGDLTYFIADKSQDLLKVDTIRSQCLVLISSLIEVFGDVATQGVLMIIEKLFKKSGEKTALDEEQKTAIPGEENVLEDDDEVREMQEFQALLTELAYVSDHPNNDWKRRESAILLAGVFIEDISMYLIRHPKFDTQTVIFDELLKSATCQDAPKGLQGLLIGRSIWCACQSSELVRMHESSGKLYAEQVLGFTAHSLGNLEKLKSVQLVALKTLTKFMRKLRKEESTAVADSISLVVQPVVKMIDWTPLDSMYLPIEALVLFSKLSPDTITSISPSVTPKLLKLFRNHHNEGSLGSELVNLFKQWSNNSAECRQIMVQSFVPFIMEIVGLYYQQTPNAENKSQQVSLKDGLAKLELQSQQQPVTEDIAAQNTVDASILAQVLDLLCCFLKLAQNDEERAKMAEVIPNLVSFLERSDDMFLLLNGTTALKTFIHLAHKQVLNHVPSERIIALTKRLLQPSCNEQAAVCLGNLVIQVIHKIQPKVDTQLLLCVVWKIYKSRMPSTVQSLICIIARLIQTNPKEILTFLSQETIDNRISLKIVLDKWLLQQPLFRGPYTRTVTISSMLKMFQARDPRVETLMVIGYNPSHSNVNSEVNAPFKMLSLLLRFLENESKPTKMRPIRKPVEDYDGSDEEKKETKQRGAFGNYEMKRVDDKEKKKEDLNMDSGQRCDTMGMGSEESYGSAHNKYDLADSDKLSVELDDVVDDDDDAIDLNEKTPEKQGEQDGEANDDDNEEGPEEETKQDSETTSSNKEQSTNTSGPSGNENMFAVGQSKDKGLADMETGSEVYMSELLAGFDMEDFDDAEEANEEDLLDLGDEFAKIDNLVTFVKDKLNSIIADEEKGCQYVYYCAKQLPKEDIELAKKFLQFPKEVPPLSV